MQNIKPNYTKMELLNQTIDNYKKALYFNQKNYKKKEENIVMMNHSVILSNLATLLKFKKEQCDEYSCYEEEVSREKLALDLKSDLCRYSKEYCEDGGAKDFCKLYNRSCRKKGEKKIKSEINVILIPMEKPRYGQILRQKQTKGKEISYPRGIIK